MTYVCEHCKSTSSTAITNCKNCGSEKILQVQLTMSIKKDVPWWEDVDFWSGILMLMLLVGFGWFLYSQAYWSSHHKITLAETPLCQETVIPCRIKVVVSNTNDQRIWSVTDLKKITDLKIGEELTVSKESLTWR